MKNGLILGCFCVFSLFLFGQNEQQKSEIQAKFDLLVAKGDSLFAVNNFTEALRQYEISCSLKPAQYQILDKIVLCHQLKEVQKLSEEADFYFAQKNFMEAKKKYMSVLTLKEKDEHARKRLSEIHDILGE
jgi:tetratricopeptide (TPR) repeat protein